MKKKRIKDRICEATILLAMAGMFLTVGAVENFSISLGKGILISGVFIISAAAAAVIGCMEAGR